MPQWWKERAQHIREKNPKMPSGMEWALATEQYKEEFGHPPRRHKKSSITEDSMYEVLIRLADVLDEKGLHEEADALDKVTAQLLPPSTTVPRSRPRMKFDPMTNPLPSKVKEVLDNPVFQAAIRANDFNAAKDVTLSIIMESEINEDDKKRILNNIEGIAESEFGPSTKELQKYLYNSWLKYIGLGVVGDLVERLLVLADKLDKKGLFSEADKIGELIV